MKYFMCGRYFIWEVTQNPCKCHPFDLMIETNNPKLKTCISICGFKNQREVNRYLKNRFILELK